MMGRRVRPGPAGAIAAVLLVLGLAPSSAWADSPAPVGTSRIDRARAAFQRGTELAERDLWAEALEAFTESERIIPHASTTYNIGYAELGLGRRTRARHWFERALEEDAARGKRELDDQQRAAAGRYLARIVTEVARLGITTPPGGVELTIDGRPLRKTPAGGWVAGLGDVAPGQPVPAQFVVELDPGAHVLSFSRGRLRGQKRVAVEKGQRVDVRLALAPPNAAPSVAPPPATSPTQAPALASVTGDRDPGKSQRLASYVVGGVGLGFVAAGAVLGSLAVVRWNEALDACPGKVHCPSDEAATLSHEASQLADLSTAGFVTGGAGLAGAVILWVTAPSPAEQTAVTLAAAPGGLGVRARW